MTECSGSGSDRKNATLEDTPDTKSYIESRNFSPWRGGALPALRGCAFAVGGLLLLSYATTCHAQQVQPSQARGSTIPTLEALPNALVVRTGEPKSTRKMSPDDLKERGIKLRAEIEKTFDKLSDAGKLSYVNDITASIAPYISAGMTFEEAESLLGAAGFSVRPHPGAREEQDPHRPRDWYAVHAEMPDFPRRVLGSVEVYVTLYPVSPGDYANVKGVEAVIFVTIL